MMGALVGAILPIGLFLSASAALAQERCLVTQYRLPATISEDVRPYLLCGLIHDRGDTGAIINGVHVDTHGQGLAGCEDVRTRAYKAAYQHLESMLPEPTGRQTYLDAEIKKADEFLLTATNLDDLGMGQEPNAPPCRKPDAQH